MPILTTFPQCVSSDFRNIILGVKRSAKRLRGKGEGKDHCDFVMRKFQCQMEDGLFHTPGVDNYDVETGYYSGVPFHGKTRILVNQSYDLTMIFRNLKSLRHHHSTNSTARSRHFNELISTSSTWQVI